jgi:hypothetical protein
MSVCTYVHGQIHLYVLQVDGSISIFFKRSRCRCVCVVHINICIYLSICLVLSTYICARWYVTYSAN